jgi:hypothetical protein
VRPRPDPLRVAQQDSGVGRHDVDQEFHAVHQHGGQRLHPVHGVPGSDPLEQFPQVSRGVRVLGGQRGGPGLDLIGDQQFPAGRGDDLGQRDVEGALVGYRERPDLLDGVAEEVDPDRMFQGGREDVHDAAADAELATSLHQIDAGVGGPDQVSRHVGDVVVGADGDPDGQQGAEPDHLGL